MYALAIDLGTTTLAASLINRGSGERIAMTGSMNPQRRFGADVVSRLNAAINSSQDMREMTSLIRCELRRMASELCQLTGIDWSDVQLVAIAGNPAMQHILMGLPLESLAFPPFRPRNTNGTWLTAFDMGWEGGADVYVFPMPGGFVGGDTVAFLYGQMSPLTLDPALFLDMGTNGEMALLVKDTIWATSTAAGPAFEGGNLSCGMVALSGAISCVQIENDRVRLKVIGDGQPQGICGSAAIEAITELLRCNILEPNGRLRDPGELSSNLSSRIIAHNGANAFVLYRDAQQLIFLSQEDIRQIQLAKSAIRAGIEVLAERSRIRFQALIDVVLTGSFGSVLRPEWLKTIGVFDENMVEISRFKPEGALAGAELALTDSDQFKTVEELAKRFRVVPLSGTPLFETNFIRNIDFPNI
ncbi:MAG: ASKHA domain-containing protein [Deltaproteobacteria bacterium]|nr:ASKHA domain-containing protein [Deltaproteobacteria bacterium]